jgi:hypothetical protein
MLYAFEGWNLSGDKYRIEGRGNLGAPMLRSSLSPDQLADLYLPDEALAALAAHAEWEYTPDSIEGASAHAEWCDDCNRWHQIWAVWGLRLDTEGRLWETVHTVDGDGDWSLCDEHPWGTNAHTDDDREADASWLRYAAWVAETGEDPLGNYVVSRPRPRVEIWRVRFGEGPVVQSAQRGRTISSVQQLPAALAVFLGTTGDGRVEGFDSLDALRQGAHGVRWLSAEEAEVRLQVERTLSSRSYRAAVRAAARKHLGSAAA